MADFYDEMQATATDLLTDFDQGGIEYIEITPGNGPADNPGPSVEKPYKLPGVARGVAFKYVNGSTIVTTDLQVTVPANKVEPKPNGFVRIDGKRHKIVSIIRKPAAGTPVAFTVIVRK